MQPMSSASFPQLENMGEFGRLTGVLWDPQPAFRDIAARPRWWPPLVIVMALSLVFTYSFTQHVGWERFMRQQFENNPRTQNMDATARDQAMAQGARFAPIMGYVGIVVGFPLMAVAAAGVFLLVFRTFMGAELTFRQSFAIYCYALVPLIISSVMTLAVLFLKDPPEFDLQYPTPTNIGAFLDPLNTPKWLLSLGGSIDVFTFWTLALVATGFSVASRKISWGTSLACVLGTWCLYVLVKVGWAALFG